MRNRGSFCISIKTRESQTQSARKSRSIFGSGPLSVSISSSSRVFHFVVFPSFVNVLGQQRCSFPSRSLGITRTPRARRVFLRSLSALSLVRTCGANCVAFVTRICSAPQMLCHERFACLAIDLSFLLSVVLVCQIPTWSGWLRWQG